MVMHRHRMTWTALRRRFKGPHGWRPIVIDGIDLFTISLGTGNPIPLARQHDPVRLAARAIEPAA